MAAKKAPKKEWPADKVERRSVEGLVPYARNARTHSDEQVAQIAASIKEWGWTVPVLVDEDGGIIAGHGRIMAARKLGLFDVPVMVAEGWSEAQKRAYVLADNKLALNAGWDFDMLGEELRGLAELGFDCELAGFDETELETLMAEKTDGLTDYQWQHEPCWYAVRKGRKGHWAGDRKQTTVWQIQHRKSETGHSTQKPVECMRRPVVNNSSPGQAVYEPFCGSGTTLIACEMEGRTAYAMELDERYCDVIVRRWQTFTGDKAKLEGDGRSFEEVAGERGGKSEAA